MLVRFCLSLLPPVLLILPLLSFGFCGALKVEQTFSAREENLLKKLLKSHNSTKARLDFLANNSTVYVSNYRNPFSIISFSERTLFGQISFFTSFVWKDSTLPTWNADELEGRTHMFIGSRPKDFWRPPAAFEGLAATEKDTGQIVIRNDGFVMYNCASLIDIWCSVIYKRRYPNERMFCWVIDEDFYNRTSINYVCKKEYYQFYYNGTISNMTDCDKDTLKQVNKWRSRSALRQHLTDYRITAFNNFGFTLKRVHSHLYTVNIVSCVSLAFITICQFLVPLQLTQRVLITVFSVVIAAENLEAVSSLEFVLSRGCPPMESVAMALLVLQALGLIWTLVASNLQEKQAPLLPLPDGLNTGLASVMAFVRALEARHQAVDKMHRLVDEPPQEATESRDAAEETKDEVSSCDWPMCIRFFDCCLSVAFALALLIVFVIFF